MTIPVNKILLNELSDWGIVKIYNDPVYPLYAIKRYDSDNGYFVFNDCGDIEDECYSGRYLLRYNNISLVDDYEEKDKAISAFEDMYDDHMYGDNSTNFRSYEEEYEED